MMAFARFRILALLALAAGLVIASQAQAQVYNRFGPANGILVGNTATYNTTAAASSDVISLWSGTCNASTFLRADGSCAAALSGTVAVNQGGTGATSLSGVLLGNGTSPVTSAASSNVISLWSGTCNATTFMRGDGSCQAVPATGVTSVGLTMPSGFSVSGSPVTSSGTLGVTTALNGVLHGNGSGFTAGNVALGSEVSGTLPVANGGIGVGTLTGIAKGNGTSAFTAAASSDVISLWSGTCNSSTFLRGDGSCQAPGGGSAGGSSGQIQYNNAGAFDGANLAYNSNYLGAGLDAFTLGAPGDSVTALLGANGGATQAGTGVQLSGGNGGSTSGASGGVIIAAGIPTDGNGGNIGITAANGVGTNRNGGAVSITAGTATGSGTPGSISLTAGTVTVNGQNVCRANGTGCPTGATLKHAAARFTCLLGTCSISAGWANINVDSINRVSAGIYEVTFTSAGFTSSPICVVTSAGTSASGGPVASGGGGFGGGNTVGQFFLYTISSGSWVATDSNFNMHCVGT